MCRRRRYPGPHRRGPTPASGPPGPFCNSGYPGGRPPLTRTGDDICRCDASVEEPPCRGTAHPPAHGTLAGGLRAGIHVNYSLARGALHTPPAVRKTVAPPAPVEWTHAGANPPSCPGAVHMETKPFPGSAAGCVPGGKFHRLPSSIVSHASLPLARCEVLATSRPDPSSSHPIRTNRASHPTLTTIVSHPNLSH